MVTSMSVSAPGLLTPVCLLGIDLPMRKASLRDYRQGQGRRLADVASAVGITPGSLSRIELGVRHPMLSTFARLTVALGLGNDEIADLVRSATSPDGDPAVADDDSQGDDEGEHAQQVAA